MTRLRINSPVQKGRFLRHEPPDVFLNLPWLLPPYAERQESLPYSVRPLFAEDAGIADAGKRVVLIMLFCRRWLTIWRASRGAAPR